MRGFGVVCLLVGVFGLCFLWVTCVVVVRIELVFLVTWVSGFLITGCCVVLYFCDFVVWLTCEWFGLDSGSVLLFMVVLRFGAMDILVGLLVSVLSVLVGFWAWSCCFCCGLGCRGCCGLV